MISNLETSTGLMKSSCYLLCLFNHIITHHDWKVINPSNPSNPSLKIPFAERWSIPVKFPLDLLTEELVHMPDIHLQHDLLFGLAEGSVYRDDPEGMQSERFRNTWIALFQETLAGDLKEQIDNPKDDWEEASFLELKTCLLALRPRLEHGLLGFLPPRQDAYIPPYQGEAYVPTVKTNKGSYRPRISFTATPPGYCGTASVLTDPVSVRVDQWVGNKLWLLWPPNEHNLAIWHKSKRSEYLDDSAPLSISYCLKHLSDLRVVLMKKGLQMTIAVGTIHIQLSLTPSIHSNMEFISSSTLVSSRTLHARSLETLHDVLLTMKRLGPSSHPNFEMVVTRLESDISELERVVVKRYYEPMKRLYPNIWDAKGAIFEDLEAEYMSNQLEMEAKEEEKNALAPSSPPGSQIVEDPAPSPTPPAFTPTLKRVRVATPSSPHPPSSPSPPQSLAQATVPLPAITTPGPSSVPTPVLEPEMEAEAEQIHVPPPMSPPGAASSASPTIPISSNSTLASESQLIITPNSELSTGDVTMLEPSITAIAEEAGDMDLTE